MYNKRYYHLALALLMSLFLSSCKDVIDVKIANNEPQLVIEGSVTDQLGPQVVTITKSVPITNTNAYPSVSGATVKIIDQTNGQSRTLVERGPGVYVSSSFLGRLGRNYTLNVAYNGQTYTAKSTMPAEKVLIDSVALSVQRFTDNTTKTLIVFFHDPVAAVNQYRFVLTVNGELVKRVFARNDQFTNGRFVQQLLYQDDVELKSGDRVDIEMQCIDNNIYTYWYTLTQDRRGGGIGSTTPTNPPGNFNTDKVLGYFSAHTTEHRNIIIP